jgi:hypothetical protein
MMTNKQAPPEDLAAYIRDLPTHERHALVAKLNRPLRTWGEMVYFPNASKPVAYRLQYFQWLVNTYIRNDQPHD